MNKKKNPKELRENRQKMKLKMHHLCEFGADTWRSEHYWNLLCFRLKCSTFLPHSKGSLDFFLHFLTLPNPQVLERLRNVFQIKKKLDSSSGTFPVEGHALSKFPENIPFMGELI